MSVALRREPDPSDGPPPSGTPERIGPYAITRQIGRGGMGIVYLGRDARLGRSVAIKVLSDSFAGDPDRLARFEREARLLASLSHPNIAVIHGLEDDGDRRFLTLEYIDGETLAERIERKPLSLADAIDVCIQIADALESAHESGVIHRDLKPGNIKVKPMGEVKVLDFGLAKGGFSGTDGDPNASPTLTHVPTGSGVILGTAAYMSPEQARGRAVDRRTDIWAFGCVLFECLTGRQAFEGETTSDTIARILVQEPDWQRLPGPTPAVLRQLLRRCLEKDPRRRLRDIGDARLALEELRAQLGSGGIAPAAEPMAGPSWRSAATAVVLALLVAAGAIAWAMLGRAPARATSRYSIVLPADVRCTFVDVTADGSGFVFLGRPIVSREADAAPRLYVRPAGRYELREVAGTIGARYAVLSRDGRSAYYTAPATTAGAGLKLYKAPLDGASPPIVLGDWSDGWSGMTELADGDLLMLTSTGRAFVRFATRTGAVAPSVSIQAPGYTGRFEIYGSRAAIGDRTVLLNGVSYGPRGWLISVGALDPRTGRAHIVVEDGGNAYMAATGALLFTRGDVLFTAPFDPHACRLRGEPVAALSDLRTVGGFWPGSYSLAANGTLVYPPGGRVGEQRRLVIVGRDGAISPLTDERKAYSQTGIVAVPRIGENVAVSATNENGLDEIWVHEAGRASLRRLVAMPADCNWPIWSPDGRRVAFLRVARDDGDGIYVQDLDGGPPRRVFRPESHDVDYFPWSWRPDGTAILMTRVKAGSSDIWMLPITPDGRTAGTPHAVIATPAQEQQPSWSPDGRWFAFGTNESGRFQIEIAPCGPEGRAGAAVPITRDGGRYPRWIAPHRVVYYDDALDKGMAVDVATMPRVTAGEPVAVLDRAALRANGFAARPDGGIVAVQRSPEEDDQARYQVVLDLFQELRHPSSH